MTMKKERPKPDWDRLRTLINVALKAIGMKPIAGKISNVDTNDEEMEIAYGLSVAFTITRTSSRYVVLHASVVRGVYRTRNGDGWPDSVDVNEIAKFRQLFGVVPFVAGKIAEFAIGDALEAFGEEELAKESYQAERSKLSWQTHSDKE